MQMYNSWLYLIREEMKVGPKGQVVIPRAIRKALKIEPGSKVTFTLENNKAIIEKPEFDALAVLRRVARSGLRGGRRKQRCRRARGADVDRPSRKAEHSDAQAHS